MQLFSSINKKVYIPFIPVINMADDTISLKDLNKAEVLAVLYNASKPQGMGFMQYDSRPMTKDEAQKLLDNKQTRFDYLKGRIMKVDLSSEELNVRGYDRDNGQGAAARAINSLRLTNRTDSELVKKVHASNTRDAARDIEGHLNDNTTHDGRVMHLGLNDVAEPLKRKVDEYLKKLYGSE